MVTMLSEWKVTKYLPGISAVLPRIFTALTRIPTVLPRIFTALIRISTAQHGALEVWPRISRAVDILQNIGSQAQYSLWSHTRVL